MTDSSTTVGVVIPVYRCAEYVRGCLESVFAQTRPVDQIVLVDDCGDDDSIAVAIATLREYQRDFILITQARNGGLGRARNAGLAATDTDLVWFLDSDDTADPEFVEELAGALERTGAELAVCRTNRVDVSGAILCIDEPAAPGPVVAGADYARDLLRGRAKAYACTKLYRREILGEHPWVQDQAYEDLTPNISMALAAERVALVDRPLYRYLQRPGSLSTTLAPTTFDLFLVGADVRGLTASFGTGFASDFTDFWYRQILIPVAHVAMRAHHARNSAGSGGRPEHYDEALARVRAGIRWRDVPGLLVRGRFRSAAFALLIPTAPGLYSAVLRWR